MAPLRVVSLDMDGTLIHPAIFNVVADALGFGEPLRVSFQKYLSTEWSIPQCFEHDYRYFVGRSVDEMQRVLETTDRWTPGIRDAVERFHDAGATVVVTTDQPRFLVDAAVRLFGVDDLVCTEATVRHGRVTAEVRPEFEKWPNLQRWLKAKRVEPATVAHVGNGRNDIPVFRNVGRSVAVNAEFGDVPGAAQHVIPQLRNLGEVADVLLG